MRALQNEGLSQRQSCALVDCPRKTAQYQSRKAPEDLLLAERLKLVAERWPRFGYRRLMIMLRRDGTEVTWWRLRRLYRSLGLEVRPRRKRHVRYIRGAAIAPVSAERTMVGRFHP